MNKQTKKRSNIMSMCWNWKGIATLIAIGAALFVFFPTQAWAIAPFLLFALCPISMFFAMRGMKEKGHENNSCASCDHIYQTERNEAYS